MELFPLQGQEWFLGIYDQFPLQPIDERKKKWRKKIENQKCKQKEKLIEAQALCPKKAN